MQEFFSYLFDYRTELKTPQNTRIIPFWVWREIYVRARPRYYGGSNSDFALGPRNFSRVFLPSPFETNEKTVVVAGDGTRPETRSEHDPPRGSEPLSPLFCVFRANFDFFLFFSVRTFIVTVTYCSTVHRHGAGWGKIRVAIGRVLACTERPKTCGLSSADAAAVTYSWWGRAARLAVYKTAAGKLQSLSIKRKWPWCLCETKNTRKSRRRKVKTRQQRRARTTDEKKNHSQTSEKVTEETVTGKTNVPSNKPIIQTICFFYCFTNSCGIFVKYRRLPT